MDISGMTPIGPAGSPPGKRGNVETIVGSIEKRRNLITPGDPYMLQKYKLLNPNHNPILPSLLQHIYSSLSPPLIS